MQKKDKNIIYTEIRNYSDQKKINKVYLDNGFKFVPHLNIIINLTKDIEVLKKELHKEKRHNIGRAKNKGLVFSEISNSNQFENSIALIKETYNRIKLPGPSTEFLIQSQLNLNDNFKCYGIYLNNELIATRIVLLFNKTVYDWYAGSNPLYNNKYANDFIVWNILEMYHNNGFKLFDFGGAGHPDKAYGVRTFKERFGGEYVNFGRYLNIHKHLFYAIGVFFIKLLKYYKYELRKFKK